MGWGAKPTLQGGGGEAGHCLRAATRSKRASSPVLRHALLRAVVDGGPAPLLAAGTLAELATWRVGTGHAAVRTHTHTAHGGPSALAAEDEGGGSGACCATAHLRPLCNRLRESGAASMRAASSSVSTTCKASLDGDHRAMSYRRHERIIATQHIHLRSSTSPGN